MSYFIKYKLSFVSDRDNDYELHILQKNYGGQPIVKKLGIAPTLSIEEGDGSVKGSSLSFSIQADVEGELRGLYTTDNKEFKILLYRNSSLYWQGFLLPELYSEEYVDAPYDVSVTATDGLATLKAITYEKQDVNVSLAAIIEDILSYTQVSLPVTYHMSIAHAFEKYSVEGGQLMPGMGIPIPMLVNTEISQAAYNGYTCYDVLNQILQSCNCCIMQIGGEWLVSSLTDAANNYYTAGSIYQRVHKILGQLSVAEIYPSGTLTLVNSPALKGANVEYSHMMRKSFLKNADCIDRQSWNYEEDYRNPIDIPGEKEAFGKIFKVYCFELHPKNISKDSILQLWQQVYLNDDADNFFELEFKYLFSTNAKLLLLSLTHYGDDGVIRHLTGEGWVDTWSEMDVNSYIQVTGQSKGAVASDFEQYEVSRVQFSLPGVGGYLKVGFINSTLNYVDPLAYAPIHVTQVYLTVGGISGQQCTTEVEPNATQEQPGVLLVYGDTFESANAYKLETNTLKNLLGENIASWWLNGKNYTSYYDVMLQEYSRYFGSKKVQLQGAIMGEDVLHNIYEDSHSGIKMRLVTAQMDLLSDEASVTLEEIVSNDVEFTAVVYATNNTNSFGTPSGGGGTVSGGSSSSVDTSHLLGREEAANTYATKAAVADLGNEVTEIREDLDALNDLLNDDVAGVINTWDEVVDFLNEYSESQDLASILSQMNADIANRVLYEDFEKLEDSVADIAGYFTNGSANNALKLGGQLPSHYATQSALNAAITNITAIGERVTTLEDLGLVRVREGSTYYIKSIYSIVSEGELISGRRASGSSSDVTGGGGISQVTAQMIVDALGYVPYSSQNPSGYITSAALDGYAKKSDIPSLSGYATQAWVEGKKYLTAIPSEYITETELSNTLGGYQSKITSSNKLAYSLISGTPTLATVATSGKYSDLSGVPTSLPASDVYAWAKAATKPTYTASEVGALSTGGGTINGSLTISRDAAVPFYIKNTQATNSLNQAILRFVIGSNYGAGLLGKSADSNLYRTDVSLSASYKIVDTGNYADTTDQRYLQLSGGKITGTITVGDFTAFGQTGGNFYLGTPAYPLLLRSNGTTTINGNTLIHSGNYSSYALPLTGGTITGASGALTIARSDANQIGILFKGQGGNLGYLGFSSAATPAYIDTAGTPFSLIHSGNIGDYALKTDGSNAMSAIAYIKWNTAEGGEDYSVYGNGFRMLTYNASTGDYRGGISIGTRYGWQLVRDGYTGTLQARFRVVDTTTWDVWKTIAFTDSNVASANKLLTSNGASMVYQTSAGHLYVGDNIYTSGDTHILGNNIRLRYGTSASYGLILNSSGNVLIGTTTDNGSGAKLQVSGNITATGEVISTRRATSSDARLKDNINRLLAEDCLAMVRNLQPSSWDWKSDGKHSLGFIAQDVEQYMPYAVTRIKDDKLGEKLNLQYDQFIALAIGGVQAVDNEVQQLKKEVAELKQRLSKYETVWQ